MEGSQKKKIVWAQYPPGSLTGNNFTPVTVKMGFSQSAHMLLHRSCDSLQQVIYFWGDKWIIMVQA